MKYFTPTKLSENIHETPEGYLLCLNVSIARTGEMIYGEGETPLEADSKGKVVIYRDEKEVFRPETIASFEGKPVTITHPEDLVTPENWAELAKGVIQNVRRGKGEQENDLVADILIMDSDAINLVKSGLREVSCGYEADYIQTEDGKGTQTEIIGNHLALVQEGRAGSSYAINDHKGKGSKMKMEEVKKKFTAIFAKAQDEAMKLADEAAKEEPAKEDKAKDAGAYDELVKMVKDLGEKISSMAKPAGDEEKPAPKKEGEEKSAKDDDMSGLEARLSKCEEMLSKLMEGMVGDEESEEVDDDEEVVGDEDPSQVGDTASRAEILSPGIKLTKDVKAQALKAAYATKDGKAMIDKLTGGKEPEYDKVDRVETLFVSASELLKFSRNKELSKTKDSLDYNSVLDNTRTGAKSAEQINEINAKHYNRK